MLAAIANRTLKRRLRGWLYGCAIDYPTICISEIMFVSLRALLAVNHHRTAMELPTVSDEQQACVGMPPRSVVRRLGASLGLPKAPHVPNFVWCALFTALGGFVFGFDTGSIGSITTMPHFVAHFSKTGALSTTVQGLIVSAILITASMASLVSGPLSDHISRTRTISLGGFIFAAGSVISCAANALPMLLVGRCIVGIGEGLFLSAVTVYAVEIAPASARGRLGSVVQLLITMGIASGEQGPWNLPALNSLSVPSGYFICYGTVRVSTSLSWRFPFGMQAVISAILAIGTPFLPHSPRWLRHVGRPADADEAWVKLGVSSADAEKTEENSSRDEAQNLGWWQEGQQMWKKGIRGRTALGIFLMGMQQVHSLVHKCRIKAQHAIHARLLGLMVSSTCVHSNTDTLHQAHHSPAPFSTPRFCSHKPVYQPRLRRSSPLEYQV